MPERNILPTIRPQHFAPPKAAYVHVPFCVHRCGYCDFTLIAGRDDLIDAYLDALETVLQRLEHPQKVRTIFLGGGTPSHLSVTQLQRLTRLINKWFHLTDDGEYSVEANPSGLTRDKAHLFAEMGVNRISLGVQSFDDDVLKLLERDHRMPEIDASLEAVQSEIDNIAIDLIFGTPGMTTELWRETLGFAVERQPAHISTYGLTIEKGTAFWSRQMKKELSLPDDDQQRMQYELSMQMLEAAGLVQYEISNFAAPGSECRHNQVYWQAESHFGFGPGAAAYIDGERRMNHRSVVTWLKKVQSGQSEIAETERLSAEDQFREAFALGLRTAAGVDRSHFECRFGVDPATCWEEETTSSLVDNGLLEITNQAIRLTPSGRCVADSIVGSFL